MESLINKNIDTSMLTNQELKIYTSERLKKFKFTITVCIVYSIITILLLLLGLFTSWGNRVLYNDLFAFIITYILGTIFIIVYMSNEIYNFKPTKFDNNMGYDAEMCPDYWTLENVNEKNYIDNKGKSYFNSSINTNHFRYKCVMDNKLFPINKIAEMDKNKLNDKKNYALSPDNKLYVKLSDKKNVGIANDTDFENFKTYAANMNGYTYKDGRLVNNNDNSLKGTNNQYFNNDTNVPLSCDTVYPLYLSVIDKDNVSKNPNDPSNKYRCAYAKTCGIAWTEAGCV